MIDRAPGALDLDVPEGPAVAGRRALHRRADLVDRAAMLAQRIRRGQRAVGAHAGAMAPAGIAQHRAGLQQARLDQHAERDARLAALAGLGRDILGSERLDTGDALAGDRGIGLVALEADVMAAEAAR